MWRVDDEFDVIWAVDADLVPEDEQGLLIMMHRDGRLRKLGLKKLPQVHEVPCELKNINSTQFRQGRIKYNLTSNTRNREEHNLRTHTRNVRVYEGSGRP